MPKKQKKKSCGILIQCGNRYLIVHATKDHAPLLTDDGHWSVPKGQPDTNESEPLTTALRETFEETGIELYNKRTEIEQLHVEYESKKRHFIMFRYNDEDMKLMNHKFYCDSYVIDEKTGKNLFPEIDRYYWATAEEFKQIVSEPHKDIFVAFEKAQKEKLEQLTKELKDASEK